MLDILTKYGSIIAVSIGLLGLIYVIGMSLYYHYALKGPNIYRDLFKIMKTEFKAYLQKGIYIAVFLVVISLGLTLLSNADIAKLFALGVVLCYLIGFINVCYHKLSSQFIDLDLKSSVAKTFANGMMYRIFISSLSLFVFMVVYLYLGNYETSASNDLSLALFAFSFGSIATAMFINEEQKWTKFYAYNIVINTFVTYICALNNATILIYNAFYPCLIMSISLLGAIISNFVLTRAKEDYEKTRQDVIYLSALIEIIGVFGISYVFYNMDFFPIFLPILIGVAFGIVYDNFLSDQVQAPKDGKLFTNITKGMNGVFISILFIAVVVFVSFIGSSGTEETLVTMTKGAYGISLAILGMQSSRYIQNDKQGIKDNNNELNSLIMIQYIVTIILVIQGNKLLAITDLMTQISLANPLMFIGLILGGGLPIATFRRYLDSKNQNMKMLSNVVISICIPIIVGLLIGVAGIITFLIGYALSSYIFSLIINGSAASYEQTADNKDNPFVGDISSRMFNISIIINLTAILFLNLYMIAEAGHGLLSMLI